MKYLVKTYKPINIIAFNTLTDAKKYMEKYAFKNDIELGPLSIDTKTISFQITRENEPQIRFERNPLNFN